MNAHHALSRPWFPFVVLLAAVVIVDVGKDIVVLSARGMPVRLWSLTEQMAWWGIWAALIPGVIWLAERLRPERIGWPRAVLLQMVAGLVFVPVHTALSAAAFTAMSPGTGAFQARFFGLMDSYFVSAFGVYSAGVATYLVWAYHLRLSERDRQAAAAELRTAHLETLVRDARMEVLRRELDPHFLHNALQSVSGLVREGENARAVTMIAALGGHLRALLSDDDRAMVPLSEEVALLKQYVAIEGVRFEDRLRVTFQLADETEDCLVPILILQPLVENAIRHGVARTTKPVSIQVGAAFERGALHLTVRDDGPGMVREGFNGTGVGLQNIRERLEHAFGGGAKLTLEIDGPGGTTARIVLPLGATRTPDAELRVG